MDVYQVFEIIYKNKEKNNKKLKIIKIKINQLVPQVDPVLFSYCWIAL